MGSLEVKRSWLRNQLANLGGREAVLLLAARAAMSAQRALVAVLVPIYLAQLGFSGAELGGLFTAVGLVSAALSFGIGFAADRIGRKPFVVYVPLLSACAAALFAFTSSTPILFIAAALGAFGRGAGAGAAQVGPYQPAEQALLAGLVKDSQRPRLFSAVASASSLGSLIGAALATTPLGEKAAGQIGPATYRPAFLAAAALPVLAAALAAFVREQPPPARREAIRRRRQAARSRRASTPLSPFSRWLARRLAITNLTNGVAVGLFGPFISYWLYRRFGADAPTIGLIYLVGNGLTVLTNLTAAPLAARLGTVRTVVFARFTQAALLIPLALSPTLAVAATIFCIRLIVQRVGLALRQSFVMGEAPAAERARVAALSQLPSQGAAALSPTLAGYLFDAVSLSVPFILAGAFQLANAALFQLYFGGGRAARRKALFAQRERAQLAAATPAPNGTSRPQARLRRPEA